MGYRDSLNVLANKENKVTYITNDHLVAGFEYTTKINTKISIEGFYKVYSNYPFALRDSLSLANLGGDYGVIGNEPVVSTSDGKAYGIEFLIQQKLFKGFYGIIAYTWVKSQFEDKRGNNKPSAWDNGNIVSATFGKKIKRNWEIGLKWRYQGGTPYTPIDVQTSSQKTVWDINSRGLNDYSQLNEKRLRAFHQLDLRIDKKFFFKKWSLDIYYDLQNVYRAKSDQPSILILDRDADGNAQTDPSNPAAYKTKLIDNSSSTSLSTLGIIIEF